MSKSVQIQLEELRKNLSFPINDKRVIESVVLDFISDRYLSSYLLLDDTLNLIISLCNSTNPSFVKDEITNHYRSIGLNNDEIKLLLNILLYIFNLSDTLVSDKIIPELISKIKNHNNVFGNPGRSIWEVIRDSRLIRLLLSKKFVLFAIVPITVLIVLVIVISNSATNKYKEDSIIIDSTLSIGDVCNIYRGNISSNNLTQAYELNIVLDVEKRLRIELRKLDYSNETTIFYGKIIEDQLVFEEGEKLEIEKENDQIIIKGKLKDTYWEFKSIE